MPNACPRLATNARKTSTIVVVVSNLIDLSVWAGARTAPSTNSRCIIGDNIYDWGCCRGWGQINAATKNAICIAQEGLLHCLSRSGPVRTISTHVGSIPIVSERTTRLPIPVAFESTGCCRLAMHPELTSLHTRKHLVRPNRRVWANCASTLLFTVAHRTGGRRSCRQDWGCCRGWGQWYGATLEAICIAQEALLHCLSRRVPVRTISTHVGSKPKRRERTTRLPIPVASKSTFCFRLAMHPELTSLHTRKHLVRTNRRVWANCASTLLFTEAHHRGCRGGRNEHGRGGSRRNEHGRGGSRRNEHGRGRGRSRRTVHGR